MKYCKKCKEVKELIEFSKDKTKKDGLCAQCKSCRKTYFSGYYKENREEILEYAKNYNVENAESISVKNAEKYLENKEAIIEKIKKHREKTKRINLEKRSLKIETLSILKKCYDCKSIKRSDEFYPDVTRIEDLSNICRDCSLSSAIEWAKNNPEKTRKNNSASRKRHPEKHCAIQAARRARKLQRTPPWTTREDLEDIQDIYTKASRMSKLTGIQYEVDHIVPLQGKNVSGLHVWWNLQILTKEENVSKSNKF